MRSRHLGQHNINKGALCAGMVLLVFSQGSLFAQNSFAELRDVPSIGQGEGRLNSPAEPAMVGGTSFEPWIPSPNDPHKRAVIRVRDVVNQPQLSGFPESPVMPENGEVQRKAVIHTREPAFEPGHYEEAPTPSTVLTAPSEAATEIVESPESSRNPMPTRGHHSARIPVPDDGVACPLPMGPSPGLPVAQELDKTLLPPYVIEAPDILLVESTQSLRDQVIRGQHLVRPDGTIGLGIYGSVRVAGLTLDQARQVVAKVVAERVKDFDARNLYVDVLAYNSKFYYVITDGGGYGEQVVRLPVTGNETVLDALSLVNGLPVVATAKSRVWLARRTPHGGPAQILPVDWVGIAHHGRTTTNYQVLPGDRIYVQADRWVSADTWLARRLAPLERLLGVTLLGSETVNSISGRGNFTTR